MSVKTKLSGLQLNLLATWLKSAQSISDKIKLDDVLHNAAMLMPDSTAVDLDIVDDDYSRAYYVLAKAHEHTHVQLQYNIYNIDGHVITIPSDIVARYEELVMPLPIDMLILRVQGLTSASVRQLSDRVISEVITLQLMEDIDDYNRDDLVVLSSDTFPN